MIIVKVISRQVVQVALAGQPSNGHLFSTVLATRNKKQLALLARNLVQSSAQSQKVSLLGARSRVVYASRQQFANPIIS